MSTKGQSRTVNQCNGRTERQVMTNNGPWSWAELAHTATIDPHDGLCNV